MALACVFVCACVDMHACFRAAQGLVCQCFSRKHMFSADRAGETGNNGAEQLHKGNKKETGVVVAPPVRLSWGVKTQDNRRFIRLRQGEL